MIHGGHVKLAGGGGGGGVEAAGVDNDLQHHAVLPAAVSAH